MLFLSLICAVAVFVFICQKAIRGKSIMTIDQQVFHPKFQLLCLAMPKFHRNDVLLCFHTFSVLVFHVRIQPWRYDLKAPRYAATVLQLFSLPNDLCEDNLMHKMLQTLVKRNFAITEDRDRSFPHAHNLNLDKKWQKAEAIYLSASGTLTQLTLGVRNYRSIWVVGQGTM